MKKSLKSPKTFLLLIAVLIICGVLSQNSSAQTNSKKDSASDTVIVKRSVINSCGQTLDELELRDKKEIKTNEKIALLEERVKQSDKENALALELAESRKREAQSEREAKEAKNDVIAAKDETIAAKDKQLENKDKEINILKKRKVSPLTKAKYIGIGVLIGKLAGIIL